MATVSVANPVVSVILGALVLQETLDKNPPWHAVVAIGSLGVALLGAAVISSARARRRTGHRLPRRRPPRLDASPGPSASTSEPLPVRLAGAVEVGRGPEPPGDVRLEAGELVLDGRPMLRADRVVELLEHRAEPPHDLHRRGAVPRISVTPSAT